MPPLPVSDRQLDAILAATAPLEPLEQSAFIMALAHRLRGEVEIGDGQLFRVTKEILRQVWKPPVLPKHGIPVHRPARGAPIA
jgi:hypothetical protein